MEYNFEHDEICKFKKYAKQTLDLMVDSYKWKILAKHCDDSTMKQKYEHISNVLMDLFMEEHNHMQMLFKED